MSPNAVACILLKRCLEFEPQLEFESEDYMVTASWPHRGHNGRTYTAMVVFGVPDAIKLLRHILARLDHRTENA